MKVGHLFAAALVAGILWFYGWTATSNWPAGRPLFGGEQVDYDNLLLHAFRHGHLYLDIPPDPRLLTAADPYDPARRPPGTEVPHDLSYYRGHYYSYFGVTPAVTLLLPWRLLTGHDLPQPYAVLIFASVGFLASALVWLAVRRRYFPESSATALFAGLAVLGLASMTHAVLRRSAFWEEPIAAGYAFAMLTLGALYLGLHARHRTAWLAAAGLFLGLAMGARPDYVVGAAAFAPPLWFVWRQGREAGSWRVWPGRSWWSAAAATDAGLAMPLAALLWYNHARFGNLWEFGWHYEMNGDHLAAGRPFGVSALGSNLYYYYWAPAQWSRYFPFVEPVHPLSGPPRAVEYVYGLLSNLPFAWLALAAPLAGAGRLRGERARLRIFVAALAVFYLAVAGLMLLFFRAATARYMLDFTPSLMLLAAVGMLGLEAAMAGWLRAAWRAGVIALAVFSAFVGIMLSFQLHELLRRMNPAAYEHLAHAFDLPVYGIERIAGHCFCPLELTVRFPLAAPGTLEPLVTTGWEDESDYLFVRYDYRSQLQLGLAHAGFPVVWSPMLTVDDRTDHRLEVQMGSLFPPRGHPFYDRADRFGEGSLSRWLRVTIDGRKAFDQAQDFYDGSPGNVELGSSFGHPESFGERFTGRILAESIGPPPELSSSVGGYGVREMTLAFPADTYRPLPLVTTGIEGRGDALRVRMVRPGIIRFGYDHWGVGLWESGNVAAASGIRHVLRIREPSLLDSLSDASVGELAIDLDGRPVWRQRVPYYHTTPERMYFGENGIGASSCEPRFTGVICAVKRL